MGDQSNGGQKFAPMRSAATVVLCCISVVIGVCAGQSRPDAAPTDSAELARKARTALMSDHFDEAIALYRKLVQTLPAESGAQLNLAMALHSAGRYQESIAQLERLRVSQARNARFWFLLGVDYLKLAQPAKAVDPLRRAVQLDGSYPPARLELAGALLESGALEKAEAAFRSLSDSEPAMAKAWQGLAISRLELSREATARLDRLAPESSFRYALAALAESAQGNLERAAGLYAKALAAAPSAPWLRAEMAAGPGSRVEPDAGRDAGHPLALAFFKGKPELVLEQPVRPQDPEQWYWRSRAYAELARAAIERLSALPPSSEQHELLGVVLQRAGRRAEAVAEWRESLRISPRDVRLRGALARSLRLNRQYDEAGILLDELTKLDPARADWHFELGDCLVNQGKPEAALPHLERAIQLQPGLLSAQALLGQILLQAGKAALAAAHLEKALPLDRDGSIHFQLANAYRDLGKPELARQTLARQKMLQRTGAAADASLLGPAQ